MPVEVMAQRGTDTLRYGPLKPVGLRDPRTGHRPWAVVQLRQENREGTLYNLVGFQTNLKFGEQKRVFGMIPGLEHAEFTRYGVMHRNTFLNSPQVLNPDYSTKKNPDLFFAGQITGVEGYMAVSYTHLDVYKRQLYRGKKPIGQTGWGKSVLNFAQDAVAYAISLTRNSLALMQEAPDILKAYEEGYTSDLRELERLEEAVASGIWDDVCGCLLYTSGPLLFATTPQRRHVPAAH